MKWISHDRYSGRIDSNLIQTSANGTRPSPLNFIIERNYCIKTGHLHFGRLTSTATSSEFIERSWQTYSIVHGSLHPRTCALGQNPKQNQIIIKRTLSLNILIVSSILLKRWYSLENYHYFCFFQFHFKLNMVRILVYFCI